METLEGLGSVYLLVLVLGLCLLPGWLALWGLTKWMDHRARIRRRRDTSHVSLPMMPSPHEPLSEEESAKAFEDAHEVLGLMGGRSVGR